MENSVILRNFKIAIQNDKNQNPEEEKEEKTTKILNVQQIHILCWNDHTIPRAEVGYKAIDTIITLIDDYRQTNKNSSVVVHCRYLVFKIFKFFFWLVGLVLKKVFLCF